MQTTHKISGDSADGYTDYLIATTRGDYYTPSGEEERETGAPVGTPSRWHGSPGVLAQLGLSRSGPALRV